jgi:CSLREA domain-containing protein
MSGRRRIPCWLAAGAAALIALGSCRDRDLPTSPEPASLLFSQTATAPVVNSLADPGTGVCDDAECTLSEALDFASPGATITFAPGLTGTISATSGVFWIEKNLTIAGPGAGTLTVSAGGEGVFYISGGTTAEISGLTLRGARGLYPAVSNAGILTVRGCMVTDNVFTSADAAAIVNWSGASLAIIESTIAGNSATGGSACGGGIRNIGTLTVTGSTISGNTRSGDSSATGGGICNGAYGYAGTATITNSTVSGNTAGVAGGGIHNQQYSTLLLTNSTVTGNTAPTGGGINHGGTLTLTNALVAANTAADEANGPDLFVMSFVTGITAVGHSLIGSASGHTIPNGTNGNIVGVAPAALHLGALEDNGGPTRTHALLAGSPALDAGTPGACPAADQRGVTRPQGSACDIGAFERETNVTQNPAAPVVNSLDDVVDASGCTDAHCSLREAIAHASSGATITFAPSVTGTITLDGSELAIGRSLILQGPGAAALAVSGSNLVRVFRIEGASVNAQIRRLTLRNGRAESGAALFMASATVTLDSVVIRNNTATGPSHTAGGGITSESGSLTIMNSAITANTATSTGAMSVGGGIYNKAGLVLVNSTVSGNSANMGAGILSHNPGNTVSLLNSTVSGNTDATQGGGIFGQDGELMLRYSTVAGNSSNSQGAGVFWTGSIILRGTLIAGNTGAPDLDDWWGMSSSQYSLIGSTAGHGITHGINGNIVGVDPLLGSLADNGGFTLTRALGAGSPAIDQIPSGTIGCGTDPATDQRGVTRPQGGACDIGAYEKEVAAGPLTPTFAFNLAALPARTYGAPPFSVASYASTNSTGAVTFSLGAGSVGCSVASAGEVTITGAATGTSYCVIEATLAPDATYAGAGPIVQQFNIARAALTLTAEDRSITYGAAAPMFDVQAAAFVGSDNVASLDGTLGFTFAGISPTSYGPSPAPPTNAGTYSITPGGVSSANYSIAYVPGSYTIHKAAGSVTINNLPASGMFGGSFTPTFSKVGDGSASVGSLTITVCTVNAGVVNYVGVGQCTLQPAVAEGTNHFAAIGTGQSFMVGKAQQEPLSVNGPISVTYGTTHTLTATGGSGTGALHFSAGTHLGCSVSGNTLSVTDASASCAVAVMKAADDNFNSITSDPLTVTLNKAATTTTGANKTATFNSAAQTVTLTATVTSSAGAVNEGKVTFTVKNGSMTVGSGVDGVVTGGSASADYTLPGGTGPAALTIEAAYSDGSNFANSNDNARTLTVLPAAANPGYVGDTWVQASSNGSVSVTLRALITDAEVLASSVAGARVTFVDVTSNNAVIGSCRDVRVDITSFGNPSEGIATCVWSFTLAKSETGRSLTVGFVIGGTHKNKHSTATPAYTEGLTISSNAPYTMLGAGEVAAPAGSSMWPGVVGGASFNINMKYNNKLTNPQGYAVVTFDVDGVTYQAKSNSLNNFSVQPATSGGTSVFSAKASIARQNEDDTWTSVEGNATLQLHVIDTGGSADLIGITVSGRNGGLVYSNNWVSGKTQPVEISSGNVTINGK